MGSAARTGAGVLQSQLTGADTLADSPEPAETLALQFERGAAIDRYTVLDRIGAGAMGVVYTAYDPRLDRRVALKVMHARPGQKGAETVARLIREAQALAKLQHPNVVAVYDANAIGDLVYLTMELVDGASLARWLKESRRTSEEILRVFVDAGRGLAAAHKAGIVHRDFKPDNVLVGRDGRVRVVDFGIARGSDGGGFVTVPPNMSEGPPKDGAPAVAAPSSAPDPEASRRFSPFASTGEGEAITPKGPALDDTDPAEANNQTLMMSEGLGSAIAGLSSMRLTRTGALVGTPAYMAPEQHLGVRVDARADQFAFCVALFEAIFKAHPFPAKNYVQLTTSVLGGKIEAVPSRTDVPVHVRRAILRGLSVDPTQRFATMDDLLKALVPDLARRRVIGWAIGAAGVAALLTGAVLMIGGDGPLCEGAERHVVGVWDAEVKEQVRVAFLGTGQPYASRAAETSAATLDAYTAGWVAMRRQACEATHVHHEQSPQLLDRRMSCLDRQLRQVAATTELFRAADREVVQRAAVAVDGLPDLSECSDGDRLMRGGEKSEADRAAIQEIEGVLAQAAAQRLTAHYSRAEELGTQALGRAREAGRAATEAQALITLGQVARDLGRAEKAVEFDAAASALAERCGADEVRAEATAELGAVLGALLHRHDEGERLLRHAAAIHERVGATSFVQARRDMFLGTVLAEKGAYDEARQTVLAAIERIRREPGPPKIVMIGALNALGSIEDRRGKAEASLGYYREALAFAEDRFGPDHPDVATVLNNIGVVEEHAGRYEAALAAYERALEIRLRTFGPDHPEIASSRMNLGNALLGEGDYERASTSFESAVAVLRRNSGQAEELAMALYNLAVCHHLRREFERALAIYEEALALREELYGPEHAQVAFPLHGLGVALVELGRLDEARPKLERALAIRSRKDVEPVDLGELRFALARAVERAEQQRALRLAAEARADYAAARAQDEVARIDAWIAMRVGK